MNWEILRRLQRHLRSRLKKAGGEGLCANSTSYENIRLGPEDIATEAYKQHLGGGRQQWEERGRFQLLFLQSMGLLPSSSFLDIGCGPLRAGVHLIDYLEPGNYVGFDYNADFITAAQVIIKKRGLTNKSPHVICISDFDCSELDCSADFALAFSVLNHCSESQRDAFFHRVPKALHANSRLYITHATWMRPAYLKSSGLRISRSINSDFIDITRHGWEHRNDIFPILELTRECPLPSHRSTSP